MIGPPVKKRESSFNNIIKDYMQFQTKNNIHYLGAHWNAMLIIQHPTKTYFHYIFCGTCLSVYIIERLNIISPFNYDIFFILLSRLNFSQIVPKLLFLYHYSPIKHFLQMNLIKLTVYNLCNFNFKQFYYLCMDLFLNSVYD